MAKRVLLGVMGLCLWVTLAQALEMGLITGNPLKTYYQLGENLRDLVARDGITLTIYPSAGSVENVLAVYERPGVQLGLAQSDVLAYIDAVPDDRHIRRIAQKVRLVFPLYPEEVHVVASHASGVVRLPDLEGKTVAIGKPASGTAQTAQTLLKLAEVTPAQVLELGDDQALGALVRGDIDAMFDVAGYPNALLQASLAKDAKIRLVPITDKAITEFYMASMIPAGTYSWQEQEVPTVAVMAALITYDYKGENCGYVGRVAKLLYDNLEWLRAHGHPKWQQVQNLDAPLKPWEQYECVTQALRGRTPTNPAPPNPITEALKKMLKAP